MEACPGSQWLARRLQALGHTVKIMPAQFVKPYVKSNKNDAVDAEAIAEAVTRPSMRFVQVKQTEQVDLQALHRARDLIVSTRTRLICQMRAFCLEYGIAMRNGAGAFKLDADVLKVLNDDTNELTPAVRHLLRELWNQLQELEARIQKFTRQIESIASRSQFARRLLTIPGIGPLGATALLAAVGDGKQFKSGRDMAAWLGLTPAQYSTGGKSTLLGVSKRGNAYSWITDLQRRMHINKVVVALANKLARIAWVVLTRPGALYQRVDPAFSGGST
jgi:transposase